ncbi:unnamed protein product [Scytosiphon promiscuus]
MSTLEANMAVRKVNEQDSPLTVPPRLKVEMRLESSSSDRSSEWIERKPLCMFVILLNECSLCLAKCYCCSQGRHQIRALTRRCSCVQYPVARRERLRVFPRLVAWSA